MKTRWKVIAFGRTRADITEGELKNRELIYSDLGPSVLACRASCQDFSTCLEAFAHSEALNPPQNFPRIVHAVSVYYLQSLDPVSLFLRLCG